MFTYTVSLHDTGRSKAISERLSKFITCGKAPSVIYSQHFVQESQQKSSRQGAEIIIGYPDLGRHHRLFLTVGGLPR